MIRIGKLNIKGCYFEDKKIKKILLNNQVLWQIQERRLPQGYTQFEYLYNKANCYVEIPFITSNHSGMKIKTFAKYGGVDTIVAGTNQGGRFCINPVNKRVDIGWMGWYSCGNMEFDKLYQDTSVNYLDDRRCIFNGNEIVINQDLTGGSSSIYLFAGKWSTSPNFYFYGAIGEVLLSQKDEVVVDLIPCRRDSDKTCGYYDIINQEFYTPSAGVLYPPETSQNSTSSANTLLTSNLLSSNKLTLNGVNSLINADENINTK